MSWSVEKPWPEDRWPTGAEFRDWALALTPDEQADLFDGLIGRSAALLDAMSVTRWRG